MTTLREAAQAVLDRWDSPAWEWLKQGPTAALMADLRAALAEPQIDDPAIYFCHRFAILMECMLLTNDSSFDKYWDEAHALLGEYHKAQEWWQHQMGEPYVSGFGKD